MRMYPKHHAMNTYGGVEVQLHAFLNSVQDGSDWSVSRPGRFLPGERAFRTHWVGGWVDPKTGLEAVTKKKISAPAGNRTPVAYFESGFSNYVYILFKSQRG